MKDFIITLIYDKVAKQYSSPLIYNNLDCAKRHFRQIVESNSSMANSGDYELYVLGHYDSFTGKLYNDEFVLLPVSLPVFEGGVAGEEK